MTIKVQKSSQRWTGSGVQLTWPQLEDGVIKCRPVAKGISASLCLPSFPCLCLWTKAVPMYPSLGVFIGFTKWLRSLVRGSRVCAKSHHETCYGVFWCECSNKGGSGITVEAGPVRMKRLDFSHIRPSAWLFLPVELFAVKNCIADIQVCDDFKMIMNRWQSMHLFHLIQRVSISLWTLVLPYQSWEMPVASGREKPL